MRLFDTATKKASALKRVDFDEALALLTHADLITLGELASQARKKKHPDPIVTYVVDRNINYTNVCVSGCKFCAFYKTPGDPAGYVISRKLLGEKIQETLDVGGTQILLQGGMNPELEIGYYEELLRFIKNHYRIHVHGFSPPEIAFISEKSQLEIPEVIRRLQQAGLDSIPGGGAEILMDSVRRRVSPNKCDSATWLGVMKAAHDLGLRTTATMMFGHLERPEDIVSHLFKIRDLQDQTGGFTAFIPWTFQPENTKIDVETASATQYLKVLAVSRIVLDTVDNIQASWVTQGGKVAQVALAFGANDFGSTMLEENVVAAAGVRFRLPEKKLVGLIRDAGFIPAKRNCFYEILQHC